MHRVGLLRASRLGRACGKQRHVAAWRSRRQRGVALLMVLLLIALLGTVVAEFQVASRVDLQLAYNARDELQAEYNALSALRFRAVLLHQSQRLQGAISGLVQLMMGDASAAPPIGAILEMIPVECGLMSALTREAGSSWGDDGDGDGDGDGREFFPGECVATSQSEHSKIAVNVLSATAPNLRQAVAALLLGFLSDRRLERHFQEDDRNGTHAETPAELVAGITDWVDPDRVDSLNSVSDEDGRYANLADPYRAKNAPFDSLDELRLVHGIDDELFAILGPQLTVYNASAQIELATASEYRIYLGLAASMVDGLMAEELFLHPGFMELRRSLYELQQLGLGLLTLKVGVLQNLVRDVGLSGIIDLRKLPLVFSDKSSTTWYTIEAQGRVGAASRRIRAVFQASEGQFYYFRSE